MAEASTNFARGQVTREQKKCLQMTRDFLMGELVCEDVVNHLISSCVLDSDDKQNILGGTKTKRAKNEKLLEVIEMRTSEGFDAFLRALKATNHDKAYTTVSGTLASIQDEGVTDRPPHSESSQLTQEAINAARGFVNFIDPNKGSEIMEILHRLAKMPTPGNNSEDPTQHLETLHQYLQAVEARLVVLKEELAKKGKWERQKDDEIVRLKRQLSEAQEKIIQLMQINQTRASQLQEAKKKNATLLNQIDNLQQENNHLNQRMDDLENKLQNVLSIVSIGSNQAMRQLDNRGPRRPGERPFKPTNPDNKK